jgi:hypothetical protein
MLHVSPGSARVISPRQLGEVARGLVGAPNWTLPPSSL